MAYYPVLRDLDTMFLCTLLSAVYRNSVDNKVIVTLLLLLLLLLWYVCQLMDAPMTEAWLELKVSYHIIFQVGSFLRRMLHLVCLLVSVDNVDATAVTVTTLVPILIYLSLISVCASVKEMKIPAAWIHIILHPAIKFPVHQTKKKYKLEIP